jgi:hypothetical protein
MQIVGAGLGRTGTLSLKLALEQLLGAPCYHMAEVFGRPDDIAVWQRAIDGDPPDWPTFFAGYEAAVDWPASAFWRELSDAFPAAPVLLSTRRDADAWWTSANDTIFQISRADAPGDPNVQAHRDMAFSLFAQRFTPDWRDEAAAKRAYEAHNAEVRATIAPDRLVDWHPGDGWAPICAALGLDVPDTAFPHVNTTEEFRGRQRRDDP